VRSRKHVCFESPCGIATTQHCSGSKEPRWYYNLPETREKRQDGPGVATLWLAPPFGLTSTAGRTFVNELHAT
jgi:hypothetical protein